MLSTVTVVANRVQLIEKAGGDCSELLLPPALATLPNPCSTDGMWANERRRELAWGML